MNFQLYATYPLDNLLSYANSLPGIHTQAEGQFLFSDSENFCIAGIHKTEESSHFKYPSKFCWVPESDSEFSIKSKVSPTVTASNNRELLLFVQVEKRMDNPKFVGKISFRSMSFETVHSQSQKKWIVSFSLSPKLTKEQWEIFGLFRSWYLWINGESILIDGISQREEILNEIVSKEHLHLAITRYEEDILKLYANREQAVIRYSPRAGVVTLSSQNTNLEFEENNLSEFRLHSGEDAYFPENTVVPRSEAISIFLHFVRTHHLPTDSKNKFLVAPNNNQWTGN